MSAFKGVIDAIKAQQGGRLSAGEHLSLALVALESAFEQMNEAQARKVCADAMRHQIKVWQEHEASQSECREHSKIGRRS